MPNKQHPHQWLEDEMQRREWSQTKLAIEAGMSNSYVSAVLQGTRGLSADEAIKIAHALGWGEIRVLVLANILTGLDREQADRFEDDPQVVEILGMLEKLKAVPGGLDFFLEIMRSYLVHHRNDNGK